MSSEEKAARLYGAAPEGDEATDASREVPDPGESPSYARLTVSYVLTASDLNNRHLGLRMRITDGGSSATGQVSQITHHADLIWEQPLFGPECYAVGRKNVKVEMGNHTITVTPEATVELLD